MSDKSHFERDNTKTETNLNPLTLKDQCQLYWKNVQDALIFPHSKMNREIPCLYAILKKSIQETI